MLCAANCSVAGVLPAEVRRLRDLADGDAVRVIDGKLHVRPVRESVARVQQRLRTYIAEGDPLSEQLNADRRRGARDE